jgi:hypothetical protein
VFILLTLHEVLNDIVTKQNCKKKWLCISQCMCEWLPVRTEEEEEEQEEEEQY